MVVDCILCCDIVTISKNMVLSRWFVWRIGCEIWVRIRYMELRQLVKMWIGSCAYSWVLSWMVVYMAISSALSMFYGLSLSDI